MNALKLSALATALVLAGCVADVTVDQPDGVTQSDLDFYQPSPIDDAVDIADPTAVLGPDTEITALVTTRGERAIEWFKAHRGSTAYEEMCELAVEISFGTRGRYASAIADWDAQVHAGRAHPGDRTPPRGALVFWRTSSFGHVAVADGNGGEWSTSVNHRIGHASLGYFSNYLGWAWAPRSWPGR